MRLVATLVAAGILLAGCSDEGARPQAADQASDFSDLGVEATDTKGVLLGVVVDEAIRPIADASVVLRKPDASTDEKSTDNEGRFAFGDLEPGTYFLEVSHLLYTAAQSSAEVVAGDKDPPIHRVQLARLFEQDPYTEQVKFEGFLACSISFPVGTTCVNDYTRLVPQCNGGCLRDYNLSRQAGNIREYVTQIAPGWQTIVMEATWERSSEATSEQLTMSVSYYSRPSASHFYGNEVSANPLRLQFDVGVAADGQNGEPELIPPEGLEELFVFYNAGGGAVAINQQFTHVQTNFYYGKAPEGWSFINGDQVPF